MTIKTWQENFREMSPLKVNGYTRETLMINEIDELRAAMHTDQVLLEVARESAQRAIDELAKVKQQAPLPRSVVLKLLDDAGYGDDVQGRADFINGLRHGELTHGITGAAKEKP